MKNYKAEAKDSQAQKLKSMTAHSDAPQDKALVKSMVKPGAMKPGYADGGSIDGGAAKPNLGKSSHKRGKGGTNVNVIIAGKGGADAGAPAGVPPMAGPGPTPPMPAGPMPPPPPPAAPGPGAGPMPPMNRGGKVCRASGGKVSGYPIKDAAGGGLGRLQKIKSYGKKAFDGEDKS